MHRDTQIGLAMSIVLIGFAAALCFPRDSRVPIGKHQLSKTVELEAAIDRRSIRVYSAAEPPRLEAVSASATTLSNSVERAGTVVSGIADHPPRSDEPVPTAATADTTNVSINLDSPWLTENEHGSKAPPGDAAELFHIVQPGDTLSGLAQKYLGSVARYPVIFEANRDQLQTPDDLRLEMRLRIPRAVHQVAEHHE
jgi:nucleoid-associated protein YgaU